MGSDEDKTNKRKDGEDIILEEHIIGHPESLSKEQTKKILEQMDNSVCKIIKVKTTGTGFICLIPFPDSISLLRVLITCNHVLNDLKIGNEIKLIFDRKEKIIIIDKLRRAYTNKEYDITIIELKEDKDNIKEYLEIDENIMKEGYNKKYIKESIYLFL